MTGVGKVAQGVSRIGSEIGAFLVPGAAVARGARLAGQGSRLARLARPSTRLGRVGRDVALGGPLDAAIEAGERPEHSIAGMLGVPGAENEYVRAATGVALGGAGSVLAETAGAGLRGLRKVGRREVEGESLIGRAPEGVVESSDAVAPGRTVSEAPDPLRASIRDHQRAVTAAHTPQPVTTQDAINRFRRGEPPVETMSPARRAFENERGTVSGAVGNTLGSAAAGSVVGSVVAPEGYELEGAAVGALAGRRWCGRSIRQRGPPQGWQGSSTGPAGREGAQPGIDRGREPEHDWRPLEQVQDRPEEVCFHRHASEAGAWRTTARTA